MGGTAMDGMKKMAGYVMMLMLAMVLAGCKTRYVTVPEVHTEYITAYERDSIYVGLEKNDCTIIVTERDTVRVERWHTIYKDRWKEKVVRDTILRTDTIPVVVEVEKDVSWWSKQKIKIGELFSLIVIIGLVLIVGKFLRSS